MPMVKTYDSMVKNWETTSSHVVRSDVRFIIARDFGHSTRHCVRVEHHHYGFLRS